MRAATPAGRTGLPLRWPDWLGGKATGATAALPGGESWLTCSRFAFVLGLCLLAAYPDVLLGSRSFFYRDFGMFGYPLAHHLRSSFWQGEVPLWNPFNNCGLPFLAQWNTMVFYPLSLFYVVLPLPWALNYFCLGHLFVAGLTMYALAHAWTGHRLGAAVAGLAYSLNGLTLHSLMWPNNIAALAWMPLVVLLVERAWREGGRRLLPAVFVAALQMLSGAPEIIVFTWAILALMWFAQFVKAAWELDSTSTEPKEPARPLLVMAARMALVVGSVGGLAAVQLWPFFDLLVHSQRTPQFGNSSWAMPGWGWANFLVPLFHCTVSRAGVYSQDDQQWTSSYYMGITVLALALLAALCVRQRRVLFLTGLALTSVILALGENAFLYPWLKNLIPMIGFARFPVKFIVLAVFAIPLLAGYAAAKLSEPGFPRVTWAGLTIVSVAVIGGLLLFAHAFPVLNEDWGVTARSGITRASFLIATAALLFCWRQGAGRCSPRLMMVVLLGLLGADALTHAPRPNPTVENWVYDPTLTLPAMRPTPGEGRAMVSPKFQRFLDYAGHPDPVQACLGHRNALLANWNLLSGVAVVSGFYSLYPREQHETQPLLYGAGDEYSAGLANFVGVSQISSSAQLFAWETRTEARPLVTIGQRPVFGSEREVLLGLSKLRPEEVVYLPSSAKSDIGVTQASSGAILSSQMRPHEWRVEFRASAPALITIAQTYYHHWRAEVDGRPAKIWRANHGFQAVEVRPGERQLILRYEDKPFRAGALISSATLLFLTGFGIMERRPARRRPEEIG